VEICGQGEERITLGNSKDQEGGVKVFRGKSVDPTNPMLFINIPKRGESKRGEGGSGNGETLFVAKGDTKKDGFAMQGRWLAEPEKDLWVCSERERGSRGRAKKGGRKGGCSASERQKQGRNRKSKQIRKKS